MRKLETSKRIILLALSGVCLALEALVFVYYWKTNFSPSITASTGVPYYWRADALQIAFYVAMLFFFSHMYGGMRIGYLKNGEVIFSQAFASLAADVLLYAQLSIMAKEFFVPQCFVYMLAGQLVIILVWNNIAYWIYKSVFPPRKMLLVHGDRPIESIVAKFQSRKDKYEIVQFVHVSDGLEEVCRTITEGYGRKEFNAVVIWDIPSQERNALMKYCYAWSIRVYMMPKITDVIIRGTEELHLFDTPILLTREYSLTVEQRFAKRLIDLVFALLLFLLTSPIMLITAIAVKLYDGGPVLYKQVRCTQDRRQFKILKFRSMRVDAEKDGVARLARKHDDRITPIGNFIRKVRIDELPQLINIIRGGHVFYRPQAGAAGDHRPVYGDDAGVCLPHEGEGGSGRICPGIRQIQYHTL